MSAEDRYLKFNALRGAGVETDDATYVVRRMRMAEEWGESLPRPTLPPRPYLTTEPDSR